MLGRIAVSSVIIIGSLALWLGGARPVAAECNPPGADLSFRKAVPLAERVVIGKVTEVRADGTGSHLLGTSTRFTLAVTHVLRGAAPDVMAIDFLVTNSCIRWVPASVGDTIALALEVRQVDPHVATNTAAWISEVPPGSAFESITVRQAFALARNAPPDTATVTEAAPHRDVPFLPLIVGAVGASAAVLRRSTRPVASH